MPYDFWEKGPFLTAGISGPDMPSGDGESREISWKARARLVLGVCDDFDAYVNELLESDEIKELLRRTECNEIDFWPLKDRHNHEVRLTVRPRLFDEVINEAYSLMLLSIRQALAGPHEDSQKYEGKPVTVKVNHIYRGHLDRLNRKINREEAKRGVYQKEIRHHARGGRRRAGRLQQHDDDSP